MKTITVALLFLLTIPSLAAPKKPLFEILDIGEYDTRPRGINNNGDIVGSISTPRGPLGFVRIGDQVTELRVPGSLVTQANDIDDDGTVVGSFSVDHHASSIAHGFIWKNGQYTILNHPAAIRDTHLYGIQAGLIVGRFEAPGIINHGFIYSNGQFTLLDVPGSQGNGSPWKINSEGKVIGTYQGAGSDFQTQHGFTWFNGQFETIDYPQPGASTALIGIGSETILGGVVGNCGFDYFLVRNGKFTLLDLPGLSIYDMNEAGLVVGDYGRNRGFVANVKDFLLRESRPSQQLSQRKN